MNLIEIPENSIVKLKVVSNSNSKNFIEFSSTTAEIYNETLLISPIVNNEGKTLNLSSDKLSVQLEYIDEADGNKTAIIWKDVIVNYINKKGVKFHQVIQTTEGKSVNRRNAFRLFLGDKATVQLIGSNEIYDVIIRDISSTGFGFVIDKDIDISVVNMCTLSTYIDEKHIILKGTIVRKQVVDEENSNKIIYGCQLSKFSAELDKLINIKQREKLKQQRFKK